MHTNPEVLVLLALGEDSATETERQHVESCEICRRELDELAHLAGVARTVEDAAPLESPHPEVWDRIRAELGFDNMNGAVHSSATSEAVSDLTAHRRRSQTDEQQEPLPAVGASGAATPVRSVSRGRRVLALALAAAIALILGVGIGLGWSQLSRPSPTVVGQAELAPIAPAWDGSRGEAVLERNAAGQEILRIRMSTPRPVSAVRQVWMMQPSGKGGMIPVGIITGDDGEWTVPVDIEADFPVIDISEEPRDGNSAHSGNSILRGTLNA